MINIPGLAKVIIDVIVYHHGGWELIITDQGSLFISKFWFLLYYFLRIKKAIYSLLALNRWPDQETKEYNWSVLQSICQLRVRWLGKAAVNNRICIQ